MRDYRKLIAEMKKQAQVPGDAPFVRLDAKLFNAITAEFGQSLADVSQSILSGGQNQVQRLIHALGPKYLFEFYLFLATSTHKFINFEGYKELLDLTEKAVDLTTPRMGLKTKEPEPKPTLPEGDITVNQILNTPIHPDVKDIKAFYRSLILRKASKIK
jgi:hypothetical protein